MARATAVGRGQSKKVQDRRIPKPSHRHAAPSGPWPYIDRLEDQENEEVIDARVLVRIGSCDHLNCSVCDQWTAYPQSLFLNWTIKPVKKCGIEDAVKDKDHPSKIYSVDVLENGNFVESTAVVVTSDNKREYWNTVLRRQRDPGIRVRALFVDKMSGPVLQMLGTTYNIEPFFFSSSINWIPSRYQENATPKKGDHITVTLTFIRVLPESKVNLNTGNRPTQVDKPKGLLSRWKSAFLSFFRWYSVANQIDGIGNIDPLAPMSLHHERKIVFPDFLGVHMVRDVQGSTIISYHHDIDGSTTCAEAQYTRMKLVGRSVYWQIIIRKSKDPTFAFLAVLWSALYAWDEAFEALYAHFSRLESHVITTNDMAITYELHVMRAHLLHYIALLRDFKMSVVFVRDTANPAMFCDDITKEEREADKKLLVKECANLISEVDRLELHRKTLDDRVQNVQKLVYTSVNIEDSKAMKRLSYISMIFLPASFVANAFGMNVVELNPQTGLFPLALFFEAAVPLTLFTIWIIMAFQNRLILQNGSSVWRRLLWPLAAFDSLVRWSTTKKGGSPYDLDYKRQD